MNVKAKVSAAEGVKTKTGWGVNADIADQSFPVQEDEPPYLSLSSPVTETLEEAAGSTLCVRTMSSDVLSLGERSIDLSRRSILGIYAQCNLPVSQGNK